MDIVVAVVAVVVDWSTTHFQLINPTTFQHYYLGISQIFSLITQKKKKCMKRTGKVSSGE